MNDGNGPDEVLPRPLPETDPWWLVPPQAAHFTGGAPWRLASSGVLVARPAAPLRSALVRLASSIYQATGIRPEVRAHAGSARVLLTVEVEEDATDLGEQAYHLQAGAAGGRLRARSRAGALYGLAAVQDLVERFGRDIPALEIRDEPAIAVRGLMVDISRTKVPTMETLKALAATMARLRMNHLELYMEHTFQYRDHPEVWAGASPMTGEEILELDAVCADLGIDLVPNQNTLGHLTRWLKLARYAPLAEVTEKSQFPWGTVSGPFSLSPANPGSLALVESLLDELLPHFQSRFVNVGLDEAYDVGQGQSRALCEAQGRGRVLLDYLNAVSHLARERGRMPMFWADMLTRHDPAVLRDMPDDVVACEWGYDEDYDFDQTLEPLAANHVRTYVCPGTASWLSFTGRAHTAEANLRRAAAAAMKHQAAGFVITDWGDRGHFQPLPVTYPGLAYGAALAWNPRVTLTESLERALGLHLLGDPTGEAGRILWAYGRMHYELVGDDGGNSARVARTLVMGRARSGIPEPVLSTLGDRMEEAADALHRALNRVALAIPDGPLVRAEMRHAAQADVLGARTAALLEGGGPALSEEAARVAHDLRTWQTEYRDLWLRRFRPGGLDESLAFMDDALARLDQRG